MISIQTLRNYEAFQGLSDEQLERIAALCREETYQAGSIVFREGDASAHLYVLEEGRVALEIKVEMGPHRSPRQTPVDFVAKGECFGWSSLVEPHILTLSAVCIEPTKVIAIDGPQLRSLLEEDHHMGYLIMKRIARLVSTRLKDTRHMLMSERGLALLSEW